ncbi:hypothetical protein Tco_0118605, partial [Tanacetum coccineum]
MGIYDFMTIPSWDDAEVVEELHGFGDSILQRVENRTTAHTTEGTLCQEIKGFGETKWPYFFGKSIRSNSIEEENKLKSDDVAFGGNTRDLGSFGEETDKTTDLHQYLSRLCSQRLETASHITRDAITTLIKTASQESATTLECITQPII